MKRGATQKQSTAEALTLDRRMLTRHHQLLLDRIKCVGCELCEAVCPTEAVQFVPGAVEHGSLTRRPTVDIDPDKCNFCGECVVVCPVNALSMIVDGVPKLEIQECGAFPILTKEISWDAAKLPKGRADVVVEACPTDVIKVDVTRTAAGSVSKVRAVEVETEGCIYCKQCEVACPEAFAATHPFEGLIRLQASLCPSGCRPCAEICPTRALFVKDEGVELDERVCVYCGACVRVCPVPEALLVRRHRVRHEPVKSGAWVSAVERLVSAELASEELDRKSQLRRRDILRFMPEAKEQ